MRGHPILAIGTMKITSQHAETIGKRPGKSVEERLLLDGVALHSADVSPRNVKLSTLVVTHLTNSSLALGDWATVSTRVAAQAVALNGLVQLAFADILIQNFAEG